MKRNLMKWEFVINLKPIIIIVGFWGHHGYHIAINLDIFKIHYFSRELHFPKCIHP